MFEKYLPQEDRTATDTGLPCWVRKAAEHLAEGKYSRVVQLCRDNLDRESRPVSGWLLYGRALMAAGQLDGAEEPIRQVLKIDPDNPAALKLLGDIRFALGDPSGAIACYQRLLEIDPHCQSLNCTVNRGGRTDARLTLRKGSTETQTTAPVNRLTVPLVTETIGDLYFAQGHFQLAAEVYRTLTERTSDPRLSEKLTRALSRTKDKDQHHVKREN